MKKTTKDPFKVGSNVVYPSHGVGKIIKIEENVIGGVPVKFFAIHLEKEKLSIRIPVNKAQKIGLRPIVSNKEMNNVLQILADKPKSHRGIWSKRAKEYEAKINSGELLLIAEVIRDLYRESNNTDRSYSEKIIYDLAINRLASEYALLHRLDPKKALDKVLTCIQERQIA